MDVLISMIICALVVLQGGFYPVVYVLFGIIFAIVVMVYCKKIPFKIEVLLIGLICATYILSCFYNKYSAETLTKAIFPLVCLLYCIFLFNMDKIIIKKAIKEIVLISTIFAAIAILSYVGLFNTAGSVASNRLQFTFQYANTAGLYFAVILLITDKEDKTINKFMPLVLTALLLTMSVGSIFLYLFGIFLIAIAGKKEDRLNLLFNNLLNILFSGFFAGSIYLLRVNNMNILISLIIFLLLVSICYINILHKKNFTGLHKNKFLILIPLCTALCMVLVFFPRLMSSSQTFVERLIQIQDAFHAMLANPFLGIGAGKWAFMKGFWQSAPYSAVYVHSSYMQVGVDAGIFAFLLVIALLAVAMRNMYKSKTNISIAVSVVILLLHGVIDFSLSFLSITLFMITLYCSEINTQTNTVAMTERKRNRFDRLPAIVLTVLCFLTMIYCFDFTLINRKIDNFFREGNYAGTLSVIEDNKNILENCYYPKLQYFNSQYMLGMMTGEVFALENISPDVIKIKAKFLELSQEKEKALEMLFDGINKFKFEEDLFDYAYELIDKLPENTRADYIKLYNEFADQSNNTRNILARFIKNLKAIKYYTTP